MNFRNYLFAIIALVLLFSCDRVKKKGGQVVDKTKETVLEAKDKLAEKKDDALDKLFPVYDRYAADTENNKKRFKEHLEVDVNESVKNIYAYGDFMGADYTVIISFTCDSVTINKIVAVKKMKLSSDPNEGGLSFMPEFPNGRKDLFQKIAPYKTGKDAEYWEYLWYDPKTGNAYYEEFSL